MDGGPTSTWGFQCQERAPTLPTLIPILQAGAEPPCPDPGDEVMAEAMPCRGMAAGGTRPRARGRPEHTAWSQCPIPNPTGVPSTPPHIPTPPPPTPIQAVLGVGTQRARGTNMALLAVAEVMAALDTTPHLVHFSSRLPQGGGFELRAHHHPGTPRPGPGHTGGAGGDNKAGGQQEGQMDGWMDRWMDGWTWAESKWKEKKKEKEG